MQSVNRNSDPNVKVNIVPMNTYQQKQQSCSIQNIIDSNKAAAVLKRKPVNREEFEHFF